MSQTVFRYFIKRLVMAKKETGANFGDTGRIKKISVTSENVVQLR